MFHQIVKKIALDDMKLRKYRASELDPRSVVVPIADVNKIIHYIKNVCNSKMSEKDIIDSIHELINNVK